MSQTEVPAHATRGIVKQVTVYQLGLVSSATVAAYCPYAPITVCTF